MKQIHHGQFKIMPWKNGKGTTCEIFRISDTKESDFVFRLSVAQITADAPFSIFPGIDRHLLILKGQGVSLKMEGKHLRLIDDGQYFSFAGETPIDCKLINGPVTDFNVMVRRDWANIGIHLTDHESLRCQNGQILVYQHTDQPVLHILDPGDMLKIEMASIVIRVDKSF